MPNAEESEMITTAPDLYKGTEICTNCLDIRSKVTTALHGRALLDQKIRDIQGVNYGMAH